MWTLVLAVACIALGRHLFRPPARLAAAALAILALIPWLPSSHAEPPRKPSTQIVYRFDDHRYLELVGYRCEGAINYVDEKRGIHTPMIDQFARVFLPPIMHADDDGDFIFIPYHEPSAFRVSKDHGKTFRDARWVGIIDFGSENIKQITIVNRQAFIETKDGRVFMTSKPFGKGWGMLVVDPVNHLPSTVFSERPEFQDLPTEVPEVKNYKGWTEMHCDPDLQGPPKATLGTHWNAFQADVLAFLGRTVAWPAAWLVRALA
ncbi:hypothetical protein G3580_00655 [Nitrogeniibacter mangrovi]|uniref:Tli3-like domain-containing protein n=1 Tax=Nitrogeniibacter mangrovi TaxID=2016596 RepID=A0A6C1AY25_9RHOO|nr:hypothetical protein [Nitrogeniibacter mangrovi]QID16262.1 hypothetical protein G3580_00655 [Nitrogeniibacter mangrovi]